MRLLTYVILSYFTINQVFKKSVTWAVNYIRTFEPIRPICKLNLQEVNLLYHNQEIHLDTFWMKFSITSGFLFRVIEIVCYIILYRVLSKHNDDMERNNIISRDLNRARKGINLLSIYAQIAGFMAENIFVVTTILWRLSGRAGPESEHSRELFAILLVLQFAFVSTVPIFASKELRTKFLAMFKQ